jgi:tetratricopeptide (TPR) repeat protein
MAYVGLADYYVVAPDYLPLRRTDTAPKAIPATQKALSLDDSLAAAHAAIASSSQDLWDWAAVDREFKRALELDPNQVNARQWYGLYLTGVGRHEEAVAQFKRGLQVDPLNLPLNTNLANAYSNMRQYDLAVDQFRKTLEIDQSYASAHSNLSSTYFDMGKYDLWLEEWKKAATLADDREELAIAEEISRAFARGGFRAAVSRDLELRKQLAQRRYVDPTLIAYDYGSLGDKDQTFYWLEKAYSDKAGNLEFIKTVKQLDFVRSDPRYLDLLKRMGLAP